MIDTKCTFIVSTCDRPKHLICLLYSLLLQTEKDFDVIVCDNTPWDSGRDENRENMIGLDSRFSYVPTKADGCYSSANMVYLKARGKYLCFPSDDDYYCPMFLSRMIWPEVDFAYCDAVNGNQKCGHKSYEHWKVEPKIQHIDKGGFIVKRELFNRFNHNEPGPCAADGFLVEDIVKKTKSIRKVNEILWVHN